MNVPLLSATGITKRYHERGRPAVDGADLEISGGSVLGIVGENGAGKSTLMHVLAGVVQADAGTMQLCGASFAPAASADALKAGIVMSFQHPRMVDSLTVWENLILGDEPAGFAGVIDRGRAIDRISSSGLSVPGLDLNSRVRNLSSGRTRLVSIMSAILRLPQNRPGVLILDEPTAACGPDETQAIFSVIRNAADSGHGVILITHKLADLEAVADAVTVMKEGRTLLRRDRPFSRESIAAILFGEDIPAETEVRKREFGAPVFIIRELGLSNRHDVRLANINLAVHAGEILGITGTRQSGIEALEEVLGGTQQPSAGTIEFKGRDVTGMTTHGLRRLKIGYVPTDRMFRGASLGSTVADNLIVLERRELQRAGVFLPNEVSRYGKRLSDEFDIDGVLHMPLSRLSGGNIQKVILGRELAENPELLIVCEPSWGLDAKSRTLIVSRIRRAARHGAAVLIMSTDIDEVLDIADTVIGLFGGRIVFSSSAGELDRAEIGRMIYGSQPGEGSRGA